MTDADDGTQEGTKSETVVWMVGGERKSCNSRDFYPRGQGIKSQLVKRLEKSVERFRFRPVSSYKWALTLWQYHYMNTAHKYTSHILNTHITYAYHTK
jgi:hypothetical protein